MVFYHFGNNLKFPGLTISVLFSGGQSRHFWEVFPWEHIKGVIQMTQWHTKQYPVGGGAYVCERGRWYLFCQHANGFPTCGGGEGQRAQGDPGVGGLGGVRAPLQLRLDPTPGPRGLAAHGGGATDRRDTDARSAPG